MSQEMHVLPPISRDGDGKLFTLTASQRKRIRSLIRKECCNYDAEHGECLLLNDGCGCTCPQMISYQILCRWFNHAVLPADETLYAEIVRDPNRRRCASCGAAFLPGSNRAKYCPVCRRKVHRKQKTESERKRRAAVDK